MNVSINHPTDRPNFTVVYVGDLTVWFSYRTPIAFQLGWSGTLEVRENEWGPTTGHHLNLIDGGDKATRVSGEEFERQLSRLTVSAQEKRNS